MIRPMGMLLGYQIAEISARTADWGSMATSGSVPGKDWSKMWKYSSKIQKS